MRTGGEMLIFLIPSFLWLRLLDCGRMPRMKVVSLFHAFNFTEHFMICGEGGILSVTLEKNKCFVGGDEGRILACSHTDLKHLVCTENKKIEFRIFFDAALSRNAFEPTSSLLQIFQFLT